MDTPTEKQKTKFRTWANAILVLAFLCIWLSGMTAGIMARSCRNERYEGAEKLRFCNISLAAAAWMKFTSNERASGSRIVLERGIALSQIGEPEKAVEAFEQALRDAQAKSGPWERELHLRMIQTEDPSALALWVSVVKAAK